MKTDIVAGKYVIAVSGGVDSVVLLDVLSSKPSLELIVAHFDHGIRKDSAEDVHFVKELACKYSLKFETARGELGKAASEARARKARYDFLDLVRRKHSARSVITAHHQDDVLETMILNLLRGTNRKGLSSLRSTATRTRPLLNITKADIRQYAVNNNLVWREDSTNIQDEYLRNYVRHHVLTRFSSHDRATLVGIYKKMLKINNQIDYEIANLLQNDEAISRSWLLRFSNNIANEIIAMWLKNSGVEISRRQVQDIVIACKTMLPTKQMQLDKRSRVRFGLHTAEITSD